MPIPPPRTKRIQSDASSTYADAEKKRPVAVVLPNSLRRKQLNVNPDDRNIQSKTQSYCQKSEKVSLGKVNNEINYTTKKQALSSQNRPKPAPRKPRTDTLQNVQSQDTKVKVDESILKNTLTKNPITSKPIRPTLGSGKTVKCDGKPQVPKKPEHLRNRSITLPERSDDKCNDIDEKWEKRRSKSFNSLHTDSLDLRSEILENLPSITSNTLTESQKSIHSSLGLTSSSEEAAQISSHIESKDSCNNILQERNPIPIPLDDFQCSFSFDNSELYGNIEKQDSYETDNQNSSKKGVDNLIKMKDQLNSRCVSGEILDNQLTESSSSFNDKESKQSSYKKTSHNLQQDLSYENVVLKKTKQQKQVPYENVSLNANEFEWVTKSFDNKNKTYNSKASDERMDHDMSPLKKYFKDQETIRRQTSIDFPCTETFTRSMSNVENKTWIPDAAEIPRITNCEIVDNGIYTDMPSNLPLKQCKSEDESYMLMQASDSIYNEPKPVCNESLNESIYCDSPSNIALSASNENTENVSYDDNCNSIYLDIDSGKSACETAVKDQVENIDQSTENNSVNIAEISQEGKSSIFGSCIATPKPIPAKSSSFKNFIKKRFSNQYEEVNIKSSSINRGRSKSMLSHEQKEKLMLLHDDIDGNETSEDELVKLQSRFIHPVDVIKPDRFIIKEGYLQKLSRKESQQRAFILLNDALLYCAGNMNQLKLKLELPLSEMKVELADSEDLKTEFSITATKRSLLLNASSAEERDEWVMALKSAISELDDSASYESVMRTDIGDVAPTWIPDNRVSMCQHCKQKFTVYNRRHHCRACGKVVCSSCSSFEAPLKYMDYNVARVCEKCFSHLQYVLQYEDEDDGVTGTLRSKFKTLRTKRTQKTRKERSRTMENNLREASLETNGFLKVKKGRARERQHWCVLQNNMFYVYKGSSDPEPYYGLPILGYDIQTTGDWEKDDFTFVLRHNSTNVETISLKAETRDAANRWMDYLRMATVLLN